MLTDAEIVRQVRAIRYSSTTERNARRAPSINALAKRSGLSRAMLYEVTNGARLGHVTRTKLSRVLTCREE